MTRMEKCAHALKGKMNTLLFTIFALLIPTAASAEPITTALVGSIFGLSGIAGQIVSYALGISICRGFTNLSGKKS
ncbi:hypothetical protein ACO34A_09910 [Rhizobium sp. ACO-34A]|nr:hypothetical protein ACO34A_09910 [Rhizobium sp. ACO-34A]